MCVNELIFIRVNIELKHLSFFFLGMDLLKHGESAYPADAWVEQQYMREDAFTVSVRLGKLS